MQFPKLTVGTGSTVQPFPPLYLTLPLSLPVDPGIAKKQVSEKPFILHLFLGNRNQVVR